MHLLPHNFPAEFTRSANLAKGDPDSDQGLVAFDAAERLSLLIRATAIVFNDPRSRALHALIERIAPSDATVMITGETGTGKELVARHVHALSQRASQRFVALNCGAFSESLIESELFGYEKGAYTGAAQGKAGWFETASDGTLFLDEIGDLPLAMQVKLLRVLQEREVVRLGGRQAVPVNVRLIVATNVDLTEAVQAGRFREDLYYRLQVIALPLLPLRERPGDILPLAQHFLQIYAKRLHLDAVSLAPDAEQALLHYPWPGNIRELENIIHRALLVAGGSQLHARDLHLPGWFIAEGNSAGDSIRLPAQLAAPAADHEGSAEPRAALLQAWRGLLARHGSVDFEALIQELVLIAWKDQGQNQLQSARVLQITRNVLRTYLKNAGAI